MNKIFKGLGWGQYKNVEIQAYLDFQNASKKYFNGAYYGNHIFEGFKHI